MGALGHEHAAGGQQVAVDAFVEPALAADALPFEVPGEVSVHERIRILEIDVDGMVEGLLRRGLQYVLAKQGRTAVQHLRDHVSHQHGMTPLDGCKAAATPAPASRGAWRHSAGLWQWPWAGRGGVNTRETGSG
ncbi:hypothetical protein D3C85_1313710 [compost metagenome]